MRVRSIGTTLITLLLLAGCSAPQSAPVPQNTPPALALSAALPVDLKASSGPEAL